MLTYKSINDLAPFYLQELISLKEACKYKLRSDCDGLLLKPVKFKTLTTLGDQSFAAAAPQLSVCGIHCPIQLGVAAQ